ncbi:MAG: hypothetical protein HY904_03455 [Deltaproteobacteria bacterium]|nr:hypothetical protein [Deltaproteobacteria bacterium]
MRQRALRFALVLGLAGVAGSALAGGGAYLQQAREKYRDLDYQALPAILAEALLQPDLKREEYLEIYKLQGFTYTALGDAPKAREAFVKLLIIDAAFEMDASVSPRFRTVFSDVKKEFQKRGEVGLTHEAPSTAPPGEGVGIELSVKDAFARVSNARARVRAVLCGKEGAWVDVPLQGSAGKEGERSFKGRLADPAASMPGDKPAGYFLDYALEFMNVIGDKVEVKGGKPTYRVTVGDAAAAARPCKSAAAATEGSEGGGGGGVPVIPVILTAGLAGGGVLLVVGLLAVGGAGATAGGGVLYCLQTGACSSAQPSRNGKVEVTTTRGNP